MNKVLSSFEYEMICEIPSEENWENMLFKRVVDVCVGLKLCSGRNVFLKNGKSQLEPVENV